MRKKRREEHQKLLNQKYELMEQLSLEYPFDLVSCGKLDDAALVPADGTEGTIRLFRTIFSGG